ncbi:MAG TPA: phage head-tail connector protein [Acidimicrobiales bacterium]|jgi:hypothetical protein
MATAWPVLSDVKSYLRLTGTETTDDTVVTQQLAAAIAWVTARCVVTTVTPGNPAFLPDVLFTVAVMEAGRLYRRRDSVDGTIGWGDMGLVRVGPKDPDIETLIAAYLNIVV